jgi:tryptophan synthase alpha chain
MTIGGSSDTTSAEASSRRTTGRVEAMFERAAAEERTALIVFTPCGYPERDAAFDVILAAVEGGADAVEIGVPFSDPLADGPTNQKAYDIALRNGFVTPDLWDLIARLRAAGVTVPLLLMGYCNPVLAYGVAAFMRDAAEAGADGVIIVDVPPEEGADLEQAAAESGLHVVYLLAPTSSDERIDLISRHASGFIYCVSVTGVTGARAAMSDDLAPFIERVRARTSLPLAIGFGISRREHVREVGTLVEAAVIGSAFVDAVGAPREQRPAAVRAFVEGITGRASG